VSLHDKDARPIAKGRLGKPVEFCYKAQITDNSDGIILDLAVYKGNPPDAGLLVPAIRRVATLFARAPRAVTADRGYGEASVEDALVSLARVACHSRPSASASGSIGPLWEMRCADRACRYAQGADGLDSNRSADACGRARLTPTRRSRFDSGSRKECPSGTPERRSASSVDPTSDDAWDTRSVGPLCSTPST
jgi:hypothetical protein